MWTVSIQAQSAPSAGSATTASVWSPPSQTQWSALAGDPVWLALVHIAGGKPSVADPDFLLSARSASAERELRATVAYLYGADPDAVCRFPARYLWLHQRLGSPTLPVERCTDYQEFLRRAPASQIDVVFASESLTQPSSSMGHLFLKLSGRDDQGRDVAHSISFYTDTATLNLPKLFWDSLVAGKRGLFALSPYDEQVHEYVDREHRNLWEYRLVLDAQTRELLLAHLIELKQTRLTYYFQAFNCATLIQQILALGSGSLLEGSGVWSTPRSVLRDANAANLLGPAHAIASARWTTRALAPSLPPERQRDVRRAVQADSIDEGRLATQPRLRSVELALARSYNDYLREEKKRPIERWQRLDGQIDELERAAGTSTTLEASAGVEPARSPAETQAYAGLERLAGADYLRVGLLPVSHRIVDDNRAYGSETEFRFFDVSILKRLGGPGLQLDEVTLYSVESLLRRDQMTGGWSGGFRLGYEPRYTARLERVHVAYAQGEVGVTTAAGPAVDLFGLIGGGFAYGTASLLYPRATVGAVVREVHSLKTVLTASCLRATGGPPHVLCEGSWKQMAYLGPRWTLAATLSERRAGGRSQGELSIELKRLL
jgi:Domain of unknown function (DUF4105)